MKFCKLSISCIDGVHLCLMLIVWVILNEYLWFKRWMVSCVYFQVVQDISQVEVQRWIRQLVSIPLLEVVAMFQVQGPLTLGLQQVVPIPSQVQADMCRHTLMDRKLNLQRLVVERGMFLLVCFLKDLLYWVVTLQTPLSVSVHN